MNLPSINIEMSKNEDGTFNIWTSTECSSGMEYRNVSAERMCELVREEILDVVENYGE